MTVTKVPLHGPFSWRELVEEIARTPEIAHLRPASQPSSILLEDPLCKWVMEQTYWWNPTQMFGASVWRFAVQTLYIFCVFPLSALVMHTRYEFGLVLTLAYVFGLGSCIGKFVIIWTHLRPSSLQKRPLEDEGYAYLSQPFFTSTKLAAAAKTLTCAPKKKISCLLVRGGFYLIGNLAVLSFMICYFTWSSEFPEASLVYLASLMFFPLFSCAILTQHFLWSSDIVAWCIENVEIIVHKSNKSSAKPFLEDDRREVVLEAGVGEDAGAAVDLDATFENVNHVAGVVRQFSATWFSYFFLAEFLLICSTVASAVGSRFQLRQFNAARDAGDWDAISKERMRLCWLAAWFTAMVFMCVLLIRAGANITSSCELAESRTLQALSRVMWRLSAASTSTDSKKGGIGNQLRRVEMLCDYIKHNFSGEGQFRFGKYNWTISYHNLMGVMYPLITVAVAVLPFLINQ